jgi:hypothetical protein
MNKNNKKTKARIHTHIHRTEKPELDLPVKARSVKHLVKEVEKKCLMKRYSALNVEMN